MTPGAFTAATEPDTYDSGEEFDYEGKHEGSVYNGNSKSNVSIYPRASHATTDHLDPASHATCRWASSVLRASRTVHLPKLVLALLHDPPAHSTSIIHELRAPRTQSSSSPTLVPRTTCSLRRAPLFHTGLSLGVAYRWATTRLRLFWDPDLRLLPSTGNAFSYATASTFPLSAILSTASARTNANTVVVSSGCRVLGCLSSFRPLSSRWTPPPTVTFPTRRWVGLLPCPRWTMFSHTHLPTPPQLRRLCPRLPPPSSRNLWAPAFVGHRSFFPPTRPLHTRPWPV